MSRFQAFGPPRLEEIARKFGLAPGLREAVRLHALVLPFQVNEYVLTRLIDWRRPEEDPVFHLFFPQPGMLAPEDERALAEASQGTDAARLRGVVAAIRRRLNPQPEHQLDLNVPSDAEGPIPGAQHKYRETLLYFPASGQTCHAYCTYCFRWAQFVGEAELRFAAADPARVVRYLRGRPDITDVLVTGGDPMVMSAGRLRRHLEPFLDLPELETIRIGTKSVASWPHRFLTDADADETLRLFERVAAAGKTLAVMAHFSHPVELSTPEAQAAVRRIRDAGAVVYGQAPIIGRVNDDAAVWEELWRAEFRAGVVPYYLFMARDTGPRDYFRVPLARAAEVFRDAYAGLPGLARTVRGPVMSATAGKVVVDGVGAADGGDAADGTDGVHGADDGDRVFRLRFLQARDPALVGRPFAARHSPTAAWIDELELAPGTPADIAAALEDPGLPGTGGPAADNRGDHPDTRTSAL